jgi:hypothetical protein
MLLEAALSFTEMIFGKLAFGVLTTDLGASFFTSVEVAVLDDGCDFLLQLLKIIGPAKTIQKINRGIFLAN